INELPRHREVAHICDDSLRIALDITRADRGFVCLFDRRAQRLVMVAHHCTDEKTELRSAPSSSALDDTPFPPVLLWNKESVESSPLEGRACACWPQVQADNFIAVPMRLQETPMGVLCMMNRHAEDEINAADRHLLGMLVRQLDTLLDNRAVHAALADSAMETLIAMVHTLEARDRYTKDHSERVGKLGAILAGGMGLSEDDIALVRRGGRLHDIGKSGIPDAVLLKPGRYSEREYAIMKAHPGIGDAILRHMDTLARERQIVRHHHERIDGNGYPDRLCGEEIPLISRIVCAADSIDAMTTHRVYRMAQPMSFCIEQLQRNSGTQFDSDVVEVALDVIDKGYVTTQASQENDESGVMPISAAA
ncbi:MAG: HD-GYP domain-containing protein, partial [Mariprofundaceae bacterium]|nr:HD-GYP domain-containing protein [Mariprofundaceae bacterium]